MRNRIIELEDGSRYEACLKFEEIKGSIKDFSKESVSIRGNIRNSKEGWSVVHCWR